MKITQYKDISHKLLNEFSGNHWLTDSYWPENKERVLMMLSDCYAKYPNAGARILEIGCGNGYIEFLFAQSNFKMSACDSWNIPECDIMFEQQGVHYFDCNLNNLQPFQEIPDQSFNGRNI